MIQQYKQHEADGSGHTDNYYIIVEESHALQS